MDIRYAVRKTWTLRAEAIPFLASSEEDAMRKAHEIAENKKWLTYVIDAIYSNNTRWIISGNTGQKRFINFKGV